MNYRSGTSPSTDIDELLKHKLRPELIKPYWDELLRLAASLRHGWAPASLLLTRLQAGSRRNPLARAPQEYGRLIKTNFVLAWLVDEELRQRVGRQLNKGEQLHALRRFLFYANEGHVRHRTPEQQTGQALCLCRGQRDHRLEHRLHPARPGPTPRRRAADHHQRGRTDLPAAHQHINAYGHHTFNLASRPSDYRPLRAPQHAVPPAARTLNRV